MKLIFLFILFFSWNAFACKTGGFANVDLVRKNPEKAKLAFIATLDFIKSDPVLKVKTKWTRASDNYYVDIFSDCSLGSLKKGKEYIFISMDEIMDTDPVNNLIIGSGYIQEVDKSRDIIEKLNLKFKK